MMVEWSETNSNKMARDPRDTYDRMPAATQNLRAEIVDQSYINQTSPDHLANPWLVSVWRRCGQSGRRKDNF